MGLQIKRRSSYKLRIVSTVIAVAALVAQPVYGFVSYQVAHALTATTIAVTPNTLSIDGGYTRTATADASSFTDLKLSFHYNANKLEAGEQLLYGWDAGQGSVASLGTIDGVSGNNEQGDVTDVALPAGADISNLTLGFSNSGADGASDNVTVNNISLTGTLTSTPSTPAPVSNGVTLASSTVNSITLHFDITHDNAGSGSATFETEADPDTTLPANVHPDLTLPVGFNYDGGNITFSNVHSWIKIRENMIDSTGNQVNSDWQTFNVQPAVAKPVENARTHAMFDTIQAAITDNGTAAGDTIDLNQDITIPAQVNVNKSVTIDGQGHTVSVDGTGYRFLVTADGASLKNMNVVKTDKLGEQDIIGIQANNVIIDTVNFTGQFNIGDNEVERGLEISGVSNVTVKNSNFNHLRQPAYINSATGTFENNHVADTKGVVAVQDSKIMFTGNSWGTNVTDIAIIQNNNNNPNNYTCAVMAQIKADNNNASIDNQVPYDTPCAIAAPTNLQLKYSGTASNFTTDSNGNYVVRDVSNNIQLSWNNDPSANIVGVRTHVVFPDGSSQNFSQGVPYTYTNLNPRDAGKKFAAKGEGKYVYTVETKDVSGKWSPLSAPLIVYYVSNIPTATFETTPAKYVNGNFTVTIVGHDTTVLDSVGADVRDPSTPQGGNSYVTGCTNGQLLGGATLPAYSDDGSGVTVKRTCTIDTSALVDGHTYTLRANAGFAKSEGGSHGNVNSDGSWTFVYDTSAPTVTIKTPTDNATASKSVYVSNSRDITISGTATDSGAGVVGQTMTVGLTDTSVSPNKSLMTKYATIQSDGSWSVTIPAGTLPDAHHVTISAATRDKAAPVYGNVGSDHAYFVTDNSAPAVPNSLSWLDSNNKSATNGFTNVQKGTLSWKDSDATVDHYVYKFWTNIPGYNYGEANAWSTDSSAYIRDMPLVGGSIWTDFNNKEGMYSFCVEAVDAAGNVSDCSDSYSVTYDATPPQLNVDAPANLVTNANTLNVTGTVTDNNLSEYRYQILDQNKQKLPGSDSNSRHGGSSEVKTDGTLFNADISNLSDGTYYISVWASDKAGNATNTSGNRMAVPYIMKFTVDRTPPAAPTITPANGTDIKGTQTFTVTKSDSSDLLSVASSAGTLVDNHDGTYSLDTTGMAKDTQVTVTATETDEANNSTAAGATYKVENPAPTVSGVTMGHYANGQYWLTGSSANSSNSQVSVLNDGTSFAGPVDVNADGSWTVSLGALPKSTSYNFTVAIANMLGYSSSLTQTFTTAPLQTSFVTPSVTQSLLRSFATIATPVNTATNAAPTVKKGANTGILGAQTTKKGVNDTSVLSPSSQGWKIFGFAWYWWLILIAAIVALWYWLAAVRRRHADEAAYLNK